jgi:hypothetical protein
MTHTPGPWKISQVENAITGEPLEKWSVAEANPPNKHEPHGIISRNDGYLTLADARLIAAAPDMLAALQDLIAYEDDEEGFFLSGDANKARAAIAKATGAAP